MKVLFANKFFYLKGGSERVFFQERDFLIEQGISVIDFSMKDSRNLHSNYSKYFVSHINYTSKKNIFGKLKHGLKFIHSSEAIEKLKSILKIEIADIAHLHNIYHQLTPAIIPFLKKQNIKIVLTLHDYKLICPSYIAIDKEIICNACNGEYFWKAVTKNCQESRAQEILLMAEGLWHKWRKSYDLVDLFISPSWFLADLVSRRISTEKIKILHNGIDFERYVPSYDEHEYGLYLGRISKEKGVEGLLIAQNLMKNKINIKVVGTGPIEKDLKNKYKQVDFLGYKTGNELNDIFSKAAFVVVPSEWYENCSMVVLESMAYGKPVIGSNIGGIPEQVEDGVTGFLFEMGNYTELSEKMDILAADPKLREKMGKSARRKVEKTYSLKKHNEKLLEIYNQLLG